MRKGAVRTLRLRGRPEEWKSRESVRIHAPGRAPRHPFPSASQGHGALLIVSLMLILLTLFSNSRVQASARSKNEEGNRLYKEKKYPEALRRYTEAQVEAPDSPQLHYNLGNVLFRQGELEKAREEYRRALAAADASLDPRAIFNLGNTFFSRQQYQEAVEAYQRTLKLNPKDMDAKRNLELALLRLKKQEQQQPAPSQGDKERDGEKRAQGTSPPTPSPSPDEKGRAGQSEERKEPGQPKGQGSKSRKGSLTREEAEQILNALQEDEKANLKKRFEDQQEETKSVDEDW